MKMLEKKLTQFGKIPDDWDIVKLGDIGSTINGLTYNPAQISENGTLVLRSSNIQNRTLTFEDNVYVKVNSSDYNEVKEDDILICVRNGSKSLIGKNTIIPRNCENFAFGAFMSVFRSHLNKYLFQLFDTDYYYSQIHRNLGATINSINGNDLKKFSFPLPPEDERLKIIKILSTWDQAIKKAHKLIDQLELRKKRLMQDLLSGEKRLPGFDGEWKELSLGEITKRITTKNEELDDTVVTISAQRGFVRQEEFFKKRVASSTLSGYYLIEKGDFAYNKSYSNGYPMGAFKRLEDFDKAVVTTLYICFSAKENVDADYLLKYFEGGLLVRNLSRIAQEGGRAHGLLNIGISDFFDLKLTLPPKDEQMAISGVFNAVDNEINLNQEKLEQLTNQKKGLMQQLLTGKKRVKTNE